jgi:hypothetical protein
MAGIPDLADLPLVLWLWRLVGLMGLLTGLLVGLPVLALLLLALRALALLLLAILLGLRLAVLRIVHPGPPWLMPHPPRARLPGGTRLLRNGLPVSIVLPTRPHQCATTRY